MFAKCVAAVGAHFQLSIPLTNLDLLKWLWKKGSLHNRWFPCQSSYRFGLPEAWRASRCQSSSHCSSANRSRSRHYVCPRYVWFDGWWYSNLPYFGDFACERRYFIFHFSFACLFMFDFYIYISKKKCIFFSNKKNCTCNLF